MARQRVLSGVQPTGTLHIGNYLGALKQWRGMVDVYDTFFCVVDLHAITVPDAVVPAELRENIRKVAALYIAAGIDPDKAAIFVQSDVRAHAELAWILTCMTPMGWLKRMTQFKSKGGGSESVGTGLFTYPALQAADILLYDTNQVPVGADQKQHVELTADIAQRFNHRFGDVFVVPEAMIPAQGARVMGLDDPTAKMSKSVAQVKPGHAIGLLDTPKQVKKALNRAVTDSGVCTRFDDASPGIRNLLTMFAAFTDGDPIALGDQYDGRGYGYLKKDLIDAAEAVLAPLRSRYHELRDDETVLDQVLEQGAERARAVADPVLKRARDAMGLGR
ncbi:MAG: tryptophan--tRNA ligase [Myxococcota bacterium]